MRRWRADGWIACWLPKNFPAQGIKEFLAKDCLPTDYLAQQLSAEEFSASAGILIIFLLSHCIATIIQARKSCWRMNKFMSHINCSLEITSPIGPIPSNFPRWPTLHFLRATNEILQENKCRAFGYDLLFSFQIPKFSWAFTKGRLWDLGNRDCFVCILSLSYQGLRAYSIWSSLLRISELHCSCGLIIVGRGHFRAFPWKKIIEISFCQYFSLQVKKLEYCMYVHTPYISRGTFPLAFLGFISIQLSETTPSSIRLFFLPSIDSSEFRNVNEWGSKWDGIDGIDGINGMDGLVGVRSSCMVCLSIRLPFSAVCYRYLIDTYLTR